ncbi:MAG: hypothetical protein AB1798_03305 [Spirochaetota bacterium]
MKYFRCITCAIIFLICIPVLQADVPVRTEEFVYSIAVFDGKSYTGTFCREVSDTIYLMADVDNFMTAKKTFVYFWPITREWKTDTETLDLPVEGIIELTDSTSKTTKLIPVKYTYYNSAGEYEINWKVFTGDDAERVYRNYEEVLKKYWADMDEYRQNQVIYDKALEELANISGKMNGEGENISKITKKLQELKPPAPPEAPRYYVNPVKTAYNFKLPQGKYNLRFISKDGQIVEGSEKKIIVFKKRRENSIGYEVIPADKWTRPETSHIPASVLYLNGSTDIFLRPFFQDEFNDLYYNKMVENDARGNENLMKWVRIQQVPKARVEVINKNGKNSLMTEQSFRVEQVKGASLGYKIIPYNPQMEDAGEEPNLIAFHIPISKDTKSLLYRLKDKDDKVYPESERQIRIIAVENPLTAVLIATLLPLLVMIPVLVIRFRGYT